MVQALLLLSIVCLCMVGLVSPSGGGELPEIKISSPAFKESELIPPQYSCTGKDVSPPLEWSGIPEKAKSLVLISDDPDAPVGTWVHWVIYDLPPTLKGLPEAVETTKNPSVGGTQGMSDFKRLGYGGPCPPSGTHRYYFKLFALDRKLGLKPGATKAEVLGAAKGHILAQGTLMGKFAK